MSLTFQLNECAKPTKTTTTATETATETEYFTEYDDDKADASLWIIGAVLGPVAVVLVLVGVECVCRKMYVFYTLVEVAIFLR